MRNRNIYWWLYTSILAVASVPAFAQNSTPTVADWNSPTQSSTTSLLTNLKEKSVASYTMWVTGPTAGDLDGQTGAGNNLTLNQFARVGYKVSSKWTVAFTQYWTNTIRSDSGGQRNLFFKDPYITASNSSITKSKKYGTNLAAYARFYLPISHESADNIGGTTDQKNGKIRIKIEPSKDFADGAINVTMPAFFIKAFHGATAKEGVSAQQNHVVWIYPTVNFNIHEKFQPYVAYSNYIEHFADSNRDGNGRWASFNEKQNLELGFNWQPAKGWNINPYMEYGPVFVPRANNVGFIAEYAFL